jgi:formamidopyrimidine-DNA glycosylase
MLGKVGLTDSIRDYISDAGLGPDALQINYETFSNLLSKGRGTVNSALMNQKLISGLGNIYTDEILYQSGVHPETKKQELTDSIIKKLYRTMDYVLQRAIENNADPEKLPSGFIIPRRHKEGTCPNCGSKLKTIKIGGRSTYFCPRCQKKSSA